MMNKWLSFPQDRLHHKQRKLLGNLEELNKGRLQILITELNFQCQDDQQALGLVENLR